MGRRATSTTKGGKFMNPTDQARKEARRRELKKNKKQRIAVRQAVIKTKDPQLMITELESLDDMELDPSNTSQYNEKVIKDKRRKLLENLIRIVDFYFKEEPSRGREFKLMVEAYKQNRKKKENYYESVKNAQTVEIGAIPLPDAPFDTPQLQDIPLPGVKPQSILKKMPPGPPSGLPPNLLGKRMPPGPPPGFPPSKKVFVRGVKPGVIPGIPMHPMRSSGPRPAIMLEDDPYDPEQGPELGDAMDQGADDDDEDEFQHRDDDDNDDDMGHGSDDEASSRRTKKRGVRFADDDEEGDKGYTKPLPSNITPLQAMMLKLAGQAVPAPPENADYDEDDNADNKDDPKDRPRPPGPPPGLPPGPPPGMPPGIMQNPSGIMPPGPPPGRPPTIPPGPPPGISHRGGEQGIRMVQNPNVLSAPPSLIHRPVADKDEDTQAATISAKPQLTANPKGDTTRFMPTSLRVRRETKGRSGPVKAGPELPTASSYAERQKSEKKRKAAKSTADAAYDSFMREMQGLL
uniref:WW domain-binding protein 11-like n=1 Tax=Phallusia mammillata TaxID=59560 RepID=A0A6F9DXC3_9ASCI|nr:WW domain-binding protein 11-like [Phallusia mammillata]